MRKAQRKPYECLVCFSSINKRKGVCDKCAAKIYTDGRIHCEGCGSIHILSREDESIFDIHPRAKTLNFDRNTLRGRLIFLGSCKDCDPDFELRSVKVEHFKIQ